MGKPSYGIDAPGVVMSLAAAAAGCAAGAVVAYDFFAEDKAVLAYALLIWGLGASLCFLFTFGLMLTSSKLGKLRVRDSLVGSLDLSGDETVLDVGCGRGLLLIGAAKRLKTGKAVGVDLWQSRDQSGNRMEVTLANARAEGVDGRIVVEPGDMRHLPFDDATADVVVSSLALHNVPEKEGRAQAIAEIARVLKPEGRAALLDVLYTRDYAEALRAAGMVDVTVSGLDLRIFPPARIVRARKPAG